LECDVLECRDFDKVRRGRVVIPFKSAKAYIGEFRYPLPAIFRSPPPKDGSVKYATEFYASPTSAASIQKHTVPQLEAILNELLVLGRALGYPDTPDSLPSSLPRTILESTINIHVQADSSHKPSMMLDMENGLPLEVEVILGEVVRIAEEVGVSVPVS
jgi:2-dehydropantoate 2-reductase